MLPLKLFQIKNKVRQRRRFAKLQNWNTKLPDTIISIKGYKIVGLISKNMKLTEYRFYFSVYKISYHPSWRHTCVWNKKKVNQSHSKVKSSSSSCSILCSERNIDHFFNFSVGMNRVVFDITIIMASASDTFNIYTLQIKAQIYLRSGNPLHQMFGMSP